MAAETRGDEQERSAPIDEYALVSDSQGAALVSRAGSIDWACLPRFGSPAIFGSVASFTATRSISPITASTTILRSIRCRPGTIS